MTTTTATTSSASSAAAQALLTSLGTGSGVDTASLVTSLVQAEFAARTAALSSSNDALTAQISAAGTLKSTMTTFNTALQTLVKGGTLSTQPVSSNAAVAVSLQPGASLSRLSSTVAVNQLAAAQSAVTKTTVGRTDQLGKGSFTLAIGAAVTASDANGATYFDHVTPADGSASVTIDFTSGGTIDDLAKAINTAKTGVTASVVTDANGSAYLTLKGQSGAGNAFTLTASGDDQASLKRFDVGGSDPGTTIAATAQNARLVVDGASVERASNTVTDLIAGVKLQLSAVTQAAVTLTTTPPTAALTEAVSDFVGSYNQVVAAVQAQTDNKTGALKSDSAAAQLQRSLRALTTANLVPGAADGAPVTLAAIGVRTNRDGTLEVDSAALTKAMSDNPAAIEAMFAPSADGSAGIASALAAVTTAATSATFGLTASVTRYSAQQAAIAKQQATLTDQTTAETTRLTQQFASMNAKISAYKSTQSFLTNQIAAWNRKDD